MADYTGFWIGVVIAVAIVFALTWVGGKMSKRDSTDRH